MKKVVPVLTIIGLMLCAVIGYLGYTAVRKYWPTKEPSDLEKYYGVSGEKTAIFLDNELQDEVGIAQNGQVYLPISWINEKINQRFYWDSNEKLLVYALPESIVYADQETKSSSGVPFLLITDEETYLSAELAASYTDIRVETFLTEPVKRIFIDTDWEPDQWYALKRKGALRERGGVKSPVVAQEEEGTSVKILEAMERWAKVRTEDGHIGYIERRRLGEEETVNYVSTFQEPVYQNISMEEKVCLVWHQVTSKSANGQIQSLLSNTKGVNVVSPTWFSLTDNEGNFSSLADKDYVEYLHRQGIQVWALLDNFSSQVQSEILLSRTSVRRKLIDGLMAAVEEYDLDGLNLDFEGIKEIAGPHYLQFIRELSVSCRKAGVVLSVDNYVPAAHNTFYDRHEQGIVADYVIIMGYDEHYAGGEAGPVSSISFVDNGIKDTLEVVPKEKVINAIPFYTRLWTTDGESQTSQVFDMEEEEVWISENQLEPEWREDLGLYYAQRQGENGLEQLWMEEERSIGEKMDLIRQYELAGVACWKLGFEKPEIWKIVSDL